MEKYEILNPDILEQFAISFVRELCNDKLNHYIRNESTNESKENIIHSAILWSRESVFEINNSKLLYGNKNVGDLLLFIDYMDILLEATEQIYRVLYATKSQFPDNGSLCFHDAPQQYSKETSRQYFKEIRAMFSSHPINLKDPDGKKRFADIPLPYSRANDIAGWKGDFSVRLWTATKDDEDTIHFPLYIKDLIDYAQLIYSRYIQFEQRLAQIANQEI